MKHSLPTWEPFGEYVTPGFAYTDSVTAVGLAREGLRNRHFLTNSLGKSDESGPQTNFEKQ